MLICINLRLVSNQLRVIYDSSYCNITPTLYMQQILQKEKHKIYHLFVHCTSKLKTTSVFLLLFIHYMHFIHNFVVLYNY